MSTMGMSALGITTAGTGWSSKLTTGLSVTPIIPSTPYWAGAACSQISAAILVRTVGSN